jgi:recombination protein RecA
MPPKPKADKKVKAPATSTSPNDKVIADIIKNFGESVLVGGDAIIKANKMIIPASPALDFAHNGGWQEGSFVVLVGPPRCGKTTTSLHFAGNAQRPQYGSREVIYLNAEARLEKRDLNGIPGLLVEPPHFRIVQSSPPTLDAHGVLQPGKILTAKDFLTIAEKFLIGTTDKVIILDSISAMVGESEWNEGLDANAVGEAQRLFSKFMRRMSQVIATNRHIFIGIVHLYANMGGAAAKGPKWLEKMSHSAQYGLATKFKASHFEAWKVGSGDKESQVGQIIFWKCERSPLGQPGLAADSYLRFGSGLDEAMELIEMATPINLIEKSGTWYEMTFVEGDKKPKVQGMEAVCNYLREHPENFEELKRQVKEGLGL